MKSTTISLDEQTLEQARTLSEKLGYSFSAWVYKLIKDAVTRAPQNQMKHLLDLSDQCAGNSGGEKWTRDEIYER